MTAEMRTQDGAGGAVRVAPLFLLHSAFFLAFLLGFAPAILREDPPQVVAVLMGFSLAAFAVECVILYVVWLVIRRLGLPGWRFFVLAAFALAAALNATLVYYGYAPFFLALGVVGRASAMLLGATIFFLLFLRAQKDRTFLRFGLALSAGVCASIAAPTLMAGVNAPLAKAEQLTKWSAIRFAQRPNVHLVSFDSMIPQPLAEKFLGVSALPYADVAIEAGSRIVSNSFVARSGSWSVLNSVVTLDDNQNFTGDGYLNGERAGSLYEVFKANGYKTAAGYAGIYFGAHGPYLDRYDYITGLNTYRIALCKFQATLAFKLQLGHFGFCEWVRRNDAAIDASWLDWPRLVEERMAATGDDPWLTLHYLYIPIGHTEADHRTGNADQISKYREKFTANAATAGDILKSLIERIRKDDPGSILFVFGDHGTWLSRTITFEEEPAFFIQDRHGVFAALPKTDNPCSTPDLSIYAKDFNTVGRTVASIIRCLAERPSDVDAAVNFVDDHDFTGFAYEPMP